MGLLCFKRTSVCSEKESKTYATRLARVKAGNVGHIYLIKEREFIKTNEPILKLGKTKCVRNRMPAYPKDSLLYHLFYCENIDDAEKQLINHFKENFTQRIDIGTEYFEHKDEKMMCDSFLNAMLIIL